MKTSSAVLACILLSGLAISGCFDTSLDLSNVVPVVSELGEVTAPEIGIHGRWGASSDASGLYPPCTTVGKHRAEACSKLKFPAATTPGKGNMFPNIGGKMCTWGEVARLVPCCRKQELSDPESTAACGVPESCHPDDPGCELGINLLNCPSSYQFDHNSIWGSLISLSFLVPSPGELAEDEEVSEFDDRKVWDPVAHGITGMSFQLDWALASDAIPLRVTFAYREFDDIVLPENQGRIRMDGTWLEGGETLKAPSSSEEGPDGAPYWYRPEEYKGGAWPHSPVRNGYNEVHFSEVYPAPTPELEGRIKPLDQNKLKTLTAVSFQVVPENTGTKTQPFSFCISDFRLLRN